MVDVRKAFGEVRCAAWYTYCKLLVDNNVSLGIGDELGRSPSLADSVVSYPPV
jgi:hypothetical protein